MYHIVKNGTAVFMGLWASVSLLLLHFFPNRWMTFLVVVLWAGVLSGWNFFLDRIFQIRQKQMLLMVATPVSFLLLFSVVEEAWLRFFLMGVLGALLCMLSLLAIEPEAEIAIMHKSFRRVHMMVWVLDAYAILTAIFGLSLFYREIPFWAFEIAGALSLGIASWQIWRMYVQMQLALWVVLLSLVLMEWMWVIHLLPFGYLMSGFLAAWVWYVGQLMIRFHITAPGILWSKQAVFLAGNGILFVSLLFVARWV